MKHFFTSLYRHLDDFLFVGGAAAVSTGAFQLHPAAGWVTAGGFLLIAAYLVSRGGS